MNIFSGNISTIEVSDSLSLVRVHIDRSVYMQVIVVETPATATYLREGNSIDVLFKETEVVIAKEKPVTSIQNMIEGVILTIERGVLLSKLVMMTHIGDMTVVLATKAIDQLQLSENQDVVALIQMNQIMLSE